MRTTLLLGSAVILLLVPRVAEARITRFVVTTRESPTFPHVRVSNTIRIAPADLVDFIARGRRR